MLIKGKFWIDEKGYYLHLRIPGEGELGQAGLDRLLELNDILKIFY